MKQLSSASMSERVRSPVLRPNTQRLQLPGQHRTQRGGVNSTKRSVTSNKEMTTRTCGANSFQILHDCCSDFVLDRKLLDRSAFCSSYGERFVQPVKVVQKKV